MRLKISGLLGLCACLFFAGCMVGPDFKEPVTKLPDRWSGLHASESFRAEDISPGLALIAWWGGFGDPVLDSLIQRAVKSNPDVRLAQARVRQARAAQGLAAAGFWPIINAEAAYRQVYGSGGSSTGTVTGTATGPGGQTGNVSGTSTPPFAKNEQNIFRMGFDASWELDIFGGTRRNIEAAAADLQASVEDRRDTLVTLISDVANNYANLRQFQQQTEIARNNLKAQQHTVDITRKRHEAGFVGGLDVANAQAQAATTESQIPVLESSAQGAIYSLSILLGLRPAALERELTPEKPILPTPPVVPVGLPSELLRRRPDIRGAEARIHAATARIGVATADLFPKFSLTGSAGTSGSDIVSLGTLSNRFWSWGPSVTWPIFDAGAIRWNIEVQNALQEQALITYEKTVLTALNEVETSLVAYSKEFVHNQLLATAVENNRKAVDLSMQLYVNGRTDFLNVINAQRSLYASEDALAQSTNALITDLIALYKALGGGWETEDKNVSGKCSSFVADWLGP